MRSKSAVWRFMKIAQMEVDIKMKRHLAVQLECSFNYCLIATTPTAFEAHAFRVCGQMFDEIPSNGNRYNEEKTLFSPRRVSLITDRSQPHLQRL
jgi:hypothetical protein